MIPISAGTLQLCIGTVYAGTMTSGSHALATAAPAFTLADVGRKITVIGAGPNTGDPYMCSLLVTTIATYVDSQHVTLTAAASFSGTDPLGNPLICGGGNSNTTVYRPLGANVANPIQYNQSLTARDTASFSFLSDDGSNTVIAEGSPVWLYDTGASADIFGGTIDQVKASDSDAPARRLRSDCDCVSWDYLLSKRLATPYRGTYTAMTLAAIALDIINFQAGSEGITVSSVTGPTLTLEPFDFVTVYDALDKLCEAASDDTHKYTWYMDAWKGVHVVEQGVTAAPWSIDDRDGSDANALDREGEGITVTWTREKLANRVYVKASRTLSTDQVDDAQQGTGSSRTFTTKANIEQLLSLDVDGTSKTFGVKGIDTGKQWYFTPGSNQFEQDPGEPMVNTTHWVHLSYYSSTASVGFDQNNTGVDAQAAVEGGTGFWDHVVSVDGLMTRDSVQALAATRASIFGEVPEALDIYTFFSGLRVAQVLSVHLITHNVSGSFLIDSVSLDCTDNIMLWTIHCVNGALIGDYRTALITLAGGGTVSAGGLLPSASSPVLGTRLVTADDTQLPTDGTVNFDPSGATPPASVTLSGAINNSQQNVTVSSGANVVNGTYIKILAETSNTTEIVYVRAGAGTVNLTVDRAQLGTLASAHSNAATVNLPGHITFQLLGISAQPNQQLILHKVSGGTTGATDINYVAVIASGSDPIGANTFPGGGTTLLLPDNSSNRGTDLLSAPGDGTTVWLILAGGGAAGAPGSGSSPSALSLAYAGSSGDTASAFAGALIATGGVLPYTFSISAGSLPPGLSLNASTGQIAGTPSAAGSYSFTGKVTDSATTNATVSITITISGAADFTLGTAVNKWLKNVDGTISSQITLPLTPPSPLAPTVGVYVYVELPDVSSGATATLDGTTTMNGSYNMSGAWNPIPIGQFRYVSGQPIVFLLPGVSQSQTTPIRIYAASYSLDREKALVRHGLSGETPNVTLNISPLQQVKPGSASNVTPIQVCGVSAQVLDAVDVGGKLKRPIAVTVDVSCLSFTPVSERWAYQLLGYQDGDLTNPPVLASGIIGLTDYATPVPAGPDGIALPHTFGPDEPTEATRIVIYAVAGEVTPQNRPLPGHPVPPGTFIPNNIVPLVTPSTTITIGDVGSARGTLNLTATILDSVSNEFHFDPATKRFAIRSVDLAKAVNFSAQFAIVGNALQLETVDASLIITGLLQVGGGVNRVSQMKVFDAPGTSLIGFIGDDTGGTGYVGAWFKRAAIGGTNPGNAQLVADASGNVALNGATFTLVSNSVLTELTNGNVTINGVTFPVAVYIQAQSGNPYFNATGTFYSAIGAIVSGSPIGTVNAAVLAPVSGAYGGVVLVTNTSTNAFVQISADAGTGQTASVQCGGGSGSIVLQSNATERHLEIDGLKVVRARLSAITKPTGGVTVDTAARTAINAVIDALGISLGHGLTAN